MRFIALALGLLLLFGAGLPGQVLPANNHEVKYVILMVPDGMNLSSVTAARIKLHGITGPPLYMERLERVGYQRTYSSINTVTDSSAAPSAWACGHKFVNNEVCFHLDGKPHNPSLLELAKWRGMSTRLVVTQTITHATGIRQHSGRSDRCRAAGPRRLLGLFNSGSLTPEYLRTPATDEPRLPDMTRAALALLERNKTGFFLMVEGSLVDSGNHAANLDYLVGEMKAFDESVKAVLEWIAAHPSRKNHTLLMVLPDHETGAVAVHGTETPGGEPFGYFRTGYTWPGRPPADETHHAGGDVVFWVQGPGAEALALPIENTDVYHVIRALLRY